MSELSIEIPSATPEIESSELHFPSELDLGTGTYTAFLAARILTSTEPLDLAREMVNRGEFVLSVTLHPDRTLVVLLGTIEPSTERTFVIPPYIDSAAPHTIQIRFADWKIMNAVLDKQRLNSL